MPEPPYNDLNQKLDRLTKWAERSEKIWTKIFEETESEYRKTLRSLESEKKDADHLFKSQEESLEGQIEQAGAEFSRKKYQLERDSAASREDVERARREYERVKAQGESDFEKLKQEKLNVEISHERQKSALQDLYEEKRRSLQIQRKKLFEESSKVEGKLRRYRKDSEEELSRLQADHKKRLDFLRDQLSAKREGWDLAIETLQRGLKAVSHEKDDLLKKISALQTEKEKELQSAKEALDITREQLDVDKATIIEKAEEDQRKLETEVRSLKEQSEKAEADLQHLITDKEKKINLEEESFSAEEKILKDTVRTEAEKRDYEQKLYEQEKREGEKTLNEVRDEYEKKKWHWDNQIRSLMMKKTVQESENEAERIRIERQTRSTVRSLEAVLGELRQRLSELKSRHKAITAQGEKESTLLRQRWAWRKERLWAMWQDRLTQIKKERSVLREQLSRLSEQLAGSRATLADDERRSQKQISDLQNYVMQTSTSSDGQKKQREIQLELEKTRFIAQIKECENLIDDWKDRLETAQKDMEKKTVGFRDQMGFLDRLFKEEEQETTLFLSSLRKILSDVQNTMTRMGIKSDAA